MSPRSRWPKSLSRRILTLVMLVGIGSGLNGCVTVSPIPTEVSVAQRDAGQLIDSIIRRKEEFRSLRALARVEYAGPEGKSGFQEAIIVQRPDRLRLETLSLLGAILIVTVNDKEIVGYHPREGLFARGALSKENIFRYVQIPLELDEITALLLGLPPVDPAMSARLDGNALIFSPNGQPKDIVAFESQLAVPTKWERFDGAGEVMLSVWFADYVSTPAGPFPSRISVEAHSQGKKLEIRYEEPELNALIPSGLFSQQKPANVQEVPIEALGG